MKKFVSIVLTLVLVLGIAIPASASQITIGTIETEEQKLARVQAEVLSGNITNDQDVIEVALEQLAEKVAYCRANGIEMDPNESLTITQVIESDASIAGADSVQDIAITGLLIVDENGNQRAIGDYYYDNDSNTISIAGGNIIATTTMTVRFEYVSSSILWDTRVYKISTSVQNFAGQTADRLQHLCVVQFGNSSYNESFSSSVVTNPTSTAPVTYYPPTRFNPKGDGVARYSGEAVITENGTVYRNVVLFNPNTYQFV